MQEKEEPGAAEAEAATDRLHKGLRTARSLVRDYKTKLCRMGRRESGGSESKGIFRFDR